MTTTQQASARLDGAVMRVLGRLAAVIFLVLAASAANISSAAACQWRVPSSFWLIQSNGFGAFFRLNQQGIHLRGTAQHASLRNRRALQGNGSVDGYIKGNTFNVDVYWGPGSAARYFGDINPQGRLTGGTIDQRNLHKRNHDARIHSEGFFTCR